MKNCCRLAAATLIMLSCCLTTVSAETRYISDQLVVSLRDQPQNGAQSITYLRTDQPVEILEMAGDFVKVQTQAGETGYIKQNYLTTNTPKTAIIKQLQRERDKLAEKANKAKEQVAAAASQSNQSQQELSSQLTATRTETGELQKKLVVSQAELKKVSQRYQALQADAKNVVAITKERDQLRQTNQELTETIASLNEEVDGLTKTGAIKWFLAGAGVLFFGWIIGKTSGGRSRRSGFIS